MKKHTGMNFRGLNSFQNIEIKKKENKFLSNRCILFFVFAIHLIMQEITTATCTKERFMVKPHTSDIRMTYEYILFWFIYEN